MSRLDEVLAGSHSAGHRGWLTRRQSLLTLGGLGLGAMLASCSAPSASAPTAPTQAAPSPAAANLATPAGASPSAVPAAQAPAWKPTDVMAVRMGVSGGLFTVPIYELAKRRGVPKEMGIDLSITETASAVLQVQAMQKGELDVGDGGPAAPMVAISEGGDLRIIGSTTTKVHYGMFATSSIKQPADLAGKSVGINALGTVPHQVSEAWLRVQNVDPKSVNFVAIGPSPEVFRAVASGKVDAGIAGMDFLQEARRQNLSVLSDRIGDDIPGYFMLAIFSRNDFGQDPKKRELYVRFLSTLALANRLMYDPSNRNEWASIAEELQKRNPEDMAGFFDYIGQRRLLAANVEFNEMQIQFVQERHVDAGVQKEVLPMDRVATLELQQEVLERVGEFTYS